MGWLKREHSSKEDDFHRELQFHVESRAKELIDRGVPASEARRRAIIELGGEEQIAQQLREVHTIAVIDTLRANLRLGLRFMRRSPGFAAAVILTLALGIGANSADDGS